MDGFAILKSLTLIAAVIAFVGGLGWLITQRELNMFVPWFWIALVVAIFAGVLWGAFSGDGMSCRNKATNMGLPYQYSTSSNCMVQDGGRWMPIDQVINNRPSS
jgi:hypothetical protein